MVTRSSRILVTGSRGFTGRHLRAALQARGHRVLGLVNDGEPGQDEYLADLTDASALRHAVALARPDFVVHLAGLAFVAHDEPTAMYSTNAMGSLNLLESLASLETAPLRVILASSANVYGSAGEEPLDESTPARPQSHYAASKLSMEAIAQVYADRLSCTITRPFNYTGPGQASHFLVPKIVEHFARRAPSIELGNLDIERDFLDVRTVASTYADLLDCEGARGAVLNICSGRAFSLRGIISILQDITGHDIRINVNPALVRGNDIRRLVGSNLRLREMLGIQPAMDMERTLRDMLEEAIGRMRP
jgi:nucleoside-diphosphate-sugar epimerase